MAPGGFDGWRVVFTVGRPSAGILPNEVVAPVTPPALILQHNLQVAHRAFLARKLAEAEAQEAHLALSLVVGTPAFDARYKQAVEEWKALCFSDSDLD